MSRPLIALLKYRPKIIFPKRVRIVSNLQQVVSISTLEKSIDCNTSPNTFQAIRYKSKKSKVKEALPDDSEDEANSDDENTNVVSGKGAEIKKFNIGSMRLDLLLKVGLGLARNKIEESFYESKIRLNGSKVSKKSTHVKTGDEVDLIRGLSPSNPKFIIVGRVEVLGTKLHDSGEAIEVKVRRSKQLVIENYPDGDPWKQSDSS